MKTFNEPVPIAPFVAWAERRLDMLRRELDPDAGEGGSPLAVLGAEIGWPGEGGQRRLFRWRSGEYRGEFVERADVEDALTHAGVDWWEVYGVDADGAIAEQRWCGWCVETVAVVDDARCVWCDRATVAERPIPRPRDRGVPSKLDEATLLKLHRVHRKGASVHAIARRIYRRAGYKNARSCHRSILSGWRRLGLISRGRVEQAQISSTKHGLTRRGQSRVGYNAYKRNVLDGVPDRPRCRGRRTHSPRRGDRCQQPAAVGSDFCWAHDPLRELERQAATARMRKRARQLHRTLPAAPFIAWIRALHAEHGTWRAVGEVTGLDQSQAARYAKGVLRGTRPLERIGVDTVARYAARAGTTVDAIYGADAGELKAAA